jgi:hypothetical protein
MALVVIVAVAAVIYFIVIPAQQRKTVHSVPTSLLSSPQAIKALSATPIC